MQVVYETEPQSFLPTFIFTLLVIAPCQWLLLQICLPGNTYRKAFWFCRTVYLSVFLFGVFWEENQNCLRGYGFVFYLLETGDFTTLYRLAFIAYPSSVLPYGWCNRFNCFIDTSGIVSLFQKRITLIGKRKFGNPNDNCSDQCFFICGYKIARRCSRY